MVTSGWANDNAIKQDREAFRAEATRALAKFTPEDRALASGMETDKITAAAVLKAWATLYIPVCRELDELEDDKKFRQTIVTNVKLSEAEATAAVSTMVADRKQSLLDEVLATIYNDEILADQRQRAAEFMQMSDSFLVEYMERYTRFVEAHTSAEKHKVQLCDQHASWLERQRQAMQVHKEQAALGKNEDTRLNEIDHLMKSMERNQASLLGRLQDHEWNFVAVLDLYRKYEKQLEKLTGKKSKNASARLGLFEKITAAFRNEQTEIIAEKNRITTLKAIKPIAEEVYSLLLEVFDLTNTERNKLLVDIEKYSKLRNERDMILLVQKNREHFLKG